MIDTEQTRLVRESAVDFVRRSQALKVARKSRNDIDGSPLRRAIAESGWFGMLVPAEAGGYGGTFADMAALCEELAKGLSEHPLLLTGVHGSRTLVHAPEGETRSRLLERAVTGELRLGVAWHGHELALARDGLVLDGQVQYVHCDDAADGILALAQSEGGPALLWLSLQRPRVTVERKWLVDGTPALTVEVNRLRLDPADVLATGEAAQRAFARARVESTVMAAAALLGVMGASFELTRGYLCTRVQFGKPIGSFQVLAHRCVDQYIQFQLARDVLDQAVQSLDHGEPLRQVGVVHRAKARCSDAAMKITRESIQMHGAIGFTEEYDAGLYLKRAMVLGSWLGNSAYHRSCYTETNKGNP